MNIDVPFTKKNSDVGKHITSNDSQLPMNISYDVTERFVTMDQLG